MEDNRYKIGQIVQKYREQNGETQEELGRILGVSRQYVSKIEYGETKLSLDKAKIIADHYKIPTHMLVDDGSIMDIKITDELDMYKEASKQADLGPLGYGANKQYYFERQTIKTKTGEVIKTYRVDDGLRGIDPKDLYVLEITNHNNILNAPVGSKVVIKYIRDNKEIKEIKQPTYLVLEWKAVAKAPDEAGLTVQKWLDKHPIPNEFITLVTPLKNLNYSLNKGKYYEELYKFVFPDGNEYYANMDDLRELCKGIVKKVIFDL